MKFAVAFLVALGAMSVAAYAHQADLVFVRHGGPAANIDANRDGWLTRAEASAGADRMFAELDTNHDGRLTDADRPQIEDNFDIEIGPDGTPSADEGNCTRTVEAAPGGHGQRVTVICNGDDDEADSDGAQHVERRVIVRRGGDHAAPRAESGRHVERDVTIIRRDGDGDEIVAPVPPVAPLPPRPPHPPHPPMFMMLMASSDEMDANHDNAISRDEFRAQQLRFFDASDVNGDGRIRFELPPAPPVPPAPPIAPAAPAPPPPPPR